MSRWPTVKLGELLRVVDRKEAVNPSGEYGLLGVRLEGRGPFLRETVTGVQTSATNLSRVVAGDFIYSRLFAWRGAFGMIDTKLDGSYVSNEFPLFRTNVEHLDTAYLNSWFRLPSVWRRVEKDCAGSTPLTRNRFKEKYFLNLEIPLPPLPEQQAIAARLDALADKTRQLTTHLGAIESAADQLLAQRFQKAIAGAPYRPMAEVAPLVRRPVVIDIKADYPELGVRSFGKGTFHKPALSGADAGTKRLFGIEPGDLIFSNVFAWEGAIAIAGATDHGRYGSHRFMTCVTDPDVAVAEFLLYYLLSPEGMAKVREASPGGAGRNRTLGVKKLEKLTVPVPSPATQRAFVTLRAKVNDLKARHARIRAANADLLPATLERLFGDPACSTE